MTTPRKKTKAAGREDAYKPMTWDADSTLSAAEKATVEAQRKDLWRGGVRREPLLTQMAFEFAAVIHMFRKAKP